MSLPLHYFLEKIFLKFYLLTNQILLSNATNIETNLSFNQKGQQKFKYLKIERGFKKKQKLLFTIFRGLSLKQIKSTFLKNESWTLV